MVTSRSPSKGTVVALAKSLIAGTNKHLGNVTQVTLAGGSYTAAQITSKLNQLVTLRTDVDASKAATKGKLAVEKTDMPALRVFTDAVVSYVKAAYGNAPEVLADFGLTPKARTPLTVEAKAAAAAKRAATRAARKTMGSEQQPDRRCDEHRRDGDGTCTGGRRIHRCARAARGPARPRRARACGRPRAAPSPRARPAESAPRARRARHAIQPSAERVADQSPQKARCERLAPARALASLIPLHAGRGRPRARGVDREGEGLALARRVRPRHGHREGRGRGVIAGASARVPDPREAARAYADAGSRGDAEALYAMMTAASQRLPAARRRSSMITFQ